MLKKKCFINTDSNDASIIANCIEHNFSITDTTLLFNEDRRMKGLQEVTRSAVYSCIKRMAPKRSAVEIIKMGSQDPMCKWARARYNWVKKLLIMFGAIKWDVNKDGHDPEWFDIKKLGTMKTSQIVYWDETHKKCQIGTSNGANEEVKFPRDDNGNIDLRNGKYSKTKKNRLKLKYENEVRLCVGVASVEMLDGVRVGKNVKYMIIAKKLYFLSVTMKI